MSDSSSEDVSEREENRGGYDCEFVTSPPEAIQAECPICLSILKEPCLISCPCGQKICRECVEKIKEDDNPCPFCNKTNFSFIRDYGLERYLKAQDVHCSKKKLGCQWKGKLGVFEQHLNQNPSLEKQLTGCGFVEVECKHGCGEWFERRFIDTHQIEECPQRPYSCEYCKEYDDSTFEDVTENHYAVCGKYPVICPNECRDDPFEQSRIEDHLNDECPLTEVSCPYAYAGCEVKLPRKDLPKHAEDIVTHFALLASFTRETAQKLEIAEQEISSLKENIITLGGFPIDYKVTNNMKEDNIYLPPFFTHPHGYKMCIRVYPNGYADGEGTHVSIYAYFMQGPFDDHLKWPFRGVVTIQIVNQAGDHSHVEKTIQYSDGTGYQYCSRVTGKQRADCGWGYHKTLAHIDLTYNAAEKTQYLKDNIMIFRVVRVKLTQ